MRILHIGKYYWPYRGGIEQVTKDLAEAAVRKGHQAAVLAHASPGSPRREVIGGVDVLRSPVLFRFLYAPLAPWFLIDLIRILGKQQPAVIHVHLPNPSAFWLLVCPPAWRSRWVLHWHADVEFQPGERLARWVYQLVYRPLEWCLLHRAAGIIVTSPNYQRSSVPLRPFQKKCQVISLCQDIAGEVDAFEVNWPEGELRVLMVGRNTPYKGHRVLGDAISKLADEGLQVSLVLVGVSEQDVRDLPPMRRLLAAGQLRCEAGIGVDRLARLYASCHLLCLPSLNRAEAFGLVLLEAMAHEKPVLASDLPDSGVGWLVDEGVNGWAFPPGDSDALAERLSWCQNNREALREAGVRGRMRLESEFSSAIVSQQVMELYARVQDG